MDKQKTTIRPYSGISLQLKELWQHRELLYFFAWRDIRVKYKQTALGITWALLQPLGLMLIFVLVFSRSSLAQASSGLRYELFVLSGLVLWNLFHTSVSHASESMITNAGIIKKIYFPRLVIPLSALVSALVDFSIGLLLLFIFCIVYSQPVHINAIIYFPIAILLVLITAFGLGTLLGALNVKFRDFRYALPFLLQMMFFATQVIYPATLVKEQWIQFIFALNPLNAALELFRYPFGTPVNEMMVITGIVSAFVLALTGLLYFKKTESYFADIV